MSQYRDEGLAARLRIETLEAQILERDASLRAREAELREAEAAVLSVDDEERAQKDARRALAAGQAAFLGVMVCLGVCATIFPLLWGSANCRRPTPFNVLASPAGQRAFGDRGAWGRATVDDARALGALCQKVGDLVCAEAAAELERQKLHAQPRVGASAR